MKNTNVVKKEIAKEVSKEIPSTIITPKGRLSYPHLLTRNTEGNYPSDKYETLLLIPKTEDISVLVKACEAVLMDMFSDEYAGLDQLKNPPVRDGDEKGGEYAGHWFIKAKSDNRPAIVGPNPKVVIDSPELVYGGQNARLSLSVYGYKKPGNKGIAFGLKNVQILGGGEPFGGGSGDPASQFPTEQEGVNDNF